MLSSLPQKSEGRRSGSRRPSIKLRARTASFEWQVSPLLLYSLPWHRARTEPSRKVSCQSASCRATLFGGSREKCFAFRSRSVDGTEYVTTESYARWLITKKQYRTPNVSVGKVKKSIAAMASRWSLQERQHRLTGSGSLGARQIHRETLLSETFTANCST